MTNKEWLDYLAHNAPDELAAWFDAEHVETEERALDGDTAATEAKIAYPMHHGYKGVKADRVIFDELHDEPDSREKLEAEASELVAEYAASGDVCDALYHGMLGLLDRQAAITAEETSGAWEEYRDATQREIAELQAQLYELTTECDKLQELNEYNALQYELASEDADRLQAQVYKLTAERDNWKEHSRTIEYRCKKAETDCEIYRKKFGKCLDYADAIHALMDDEGMA